MSNLDPYTSVELSFIVNSAQQEINIDGNLQITVKASIQDILKEIGMVDLVNELGSETILEGMGLSDIIEYCTPQELLETIEDAEIDYYTKKRLEASDKAWKQLNNVQIDLELANQKIDELEQKIDEKNKKIRELKQKNKEL